MLNRSPAAPDPAIAPALPSLGDLDYRVQGLLPTDSKMSEILLATDRRNQTVILKIACVQQRARAETNRRAIYNSVAWLQGLCDHAGIAQMQPIHRKGQRGPQTWFAPPTFIATLPDWPDNPDFLITEYLAGGTLNAFVGKRPLPLVLALGLAHDLAQTLAYLHSHHCVHRDLKPENILFREPPTRSAKPGACQPVLIDFGVAAQIGEAKLIAGSRLWMAPELQEAGEKALLPIDPAWDVYALGLICCYMLSGLRPWRRQYAYQDYVDYRTHVFAGLRQATTAIDVDQQVISTLQQLLDRALARSPRQRPTAAEFAAALARLLEQMGVVLPVRKLPARAPVAQLVARLPDVQRRVQPRWLWGGLAILVVVSWSLLTLMADSDGSVRTQAAAPAQPSASITEPATLPAINARAALLPVMGEQQGLTQPSVLAGKPTATLPPPTLAARPPTPTQSIPTLAALVLPLLTTPPTLVAFTPTQAPIVSPTATRLPPTVTATASPTRPLPTATRSTTPTRQPSPGFGTIRLGTPPAGLVSAQERVEFAWQIAGATLAADACYELVFWDPNKASDKRSPIGAGRTAQGTVTFGKLRESPDPLLRRLARSPHGLDWGVRFVSCTDPQTILQDVSETRHYTYQP